MVKVLASVILFIVALCAYITLSLLAWISWQFGVVPAFGAPEISIYNVGALLLGVIILLFLRHLMDPYHYKKGGSK